MSPPPIYSTDDYKIDGMQLIPKLVKSLMHRKVIKISSGGVHNICIVEPQPSSLLEDVYKQFMNGLYTDVVFKGFYSICDPSRENSVMGTDKDRTNGASQLSQHSNSDEEMKDSSEIKLGNSDIRIGEQTNVSQPQDSKEGSDASKRSRSISEVKKSQKKLDNFWK